jgi:hypothetical protein
MPSNPFATALQTGAQPYMRLAQANLALMTDFWLSPEVLAGTYLNTQRLYSPSAPSAPGTSTDVFSRVTKGLLENYSRFFSDLLQASMSLWSGGAQRFGAGFIGEAPAGASPGQPMARSTP